MSTTPKLPNPFHGSEHQSKAPFVLNRPSVEEWVRDALDGRSSSPRLLLIKGEQGLGKTTLLHLLHHATDEQHTFYFDCQTLPSASISVFLYHLTRTLFEQIDDAPASNESHIQQTDFVANPYRTFAQQLKKLETAVKAPRLLLLGDNFDAVWERLGDVSKPFDMFEKLGDTLAQSEKSWLLLTSSPNLQWASPPEAVFQTLTIRPFTREETAQFIQQPLRLTIVEDVYNYIYALTEGNPKQLHILCHAIFDYYQERNLQQLTRADVAYVWQKNGLDQHISDGMHRLQTHVEEQNTVQTVSKWRPLPRKQLAWLGGVALLLLIAFLTAGPVLAQLRGRNMEPTAVSFVPQTAVAAPILSNETQTPTESPPTQTSTQPPTNTSRPSQTPSPTTTATPTATPTKTPLAYPPTIIRSDDNMPMRLIPSGTFLMGSAEDDFLSSPDEMPQREVTMDRFYIDQYEVSVEQFAQFTNSLGSPYRACEFSDCVQPRNLAGYTSYLTEQDLGDGTIQYTPFVGFASYPINHVSWYGAKAYCESVGARLPTEAEWEYAARGSDGRLYPWGNEAPTENLATFNSESYDNMKPVDALPEGASPFGVLNMSGSLWEWTGDWYDEQYYAEAPDNNPPGPETGFARVIRGGGWPFNNQADRLRVANRNQLSPDFMSSTVGFRCVREIE